MTFTALLVEPSQAHRQITRAWEIAKQSIGDGRRMVLELKPPTRSNAANAKLHALLTELSRKGQWCGKKLDVVTWKRLCTAAWLREQGESPEMIPALDGNGFDVIFERTSQMSGEQVSSLIQWIEAFCAEQWIELDG